MKTLVKALGGGPSLAERAGRSPAARDWRGVQAITFDVGNTLFPFTQRQMDDLLHRFARYVSSRLGPCDEAGLISRYEAVRSDQYRRNLPHLRENDLIERIELTLRFVTDDVPPELLAEVTEAYLDCLVEALPLPPEVPGLLERLEKRYRLGLITNYPYSPGTRRLIRAKGLWDLFDSVVISADWEFIKPHPLLFRQAARELGVPLEALLHVGDDWEADIIGAARAGAKSVLFLGLREDEDPRRGDPAGKPLATLFDLAELPGLLGM